MTCAETEDLHFVAAAAALAKGLVAGGGGGFFPVPLPAVRLLSVARTGLILRRSASRVTRFSNSAMKRLRLRRPPQR
jgi:hypothetical protein